MKNFQKGNIALALASLLTAPMVNAAEVTDKLTVSGFLDMSWYYADVDGMGSDQTFGVDQFEVDFAYDFDGKLKAQVDIDHDGDQVDVEQAFITYAASDSVTLKAGRFLSYSGWEAAEPTGLFQYSAVGYAGLFYGGYQEGFSALYSGGTFSAAVSVVNDLAGGSARGSETPAIETMLAFMPTEAITVKAFYSVDKLEGTDETIKLFNIWSSYSAGPLTLAVEYNQADNSAFEGSEADGYLAMANYAFDNGWGLTGRYHSFEVEGVYEESGITISPSYKVSDNLLMVFEVRMDEVNDVDVTSAAVEALITF